MQIITQLRKDIHRLASLRRAKTMRWFFKTGKGQYGYGDKFLGVSVPQQRRVAKKYHDLPLARVLELLKSPYHEHRLTAVFILNLQFSQGNEQIKKTIAKLYVKNARFVNNWDIVDSSAPHILGNYLLDKPRAVLYRLVKSKNIWERRIAIIATQTFIRHGQFNDTLKLAKILLNDDHDLVHKAVGWMLREIGDRDRRTEEIFLKQYARRMPRTMLRYAIEKFPRTARHKYLVASG